MRQVIYCSIYNEICTRDYCVKRRVCGWNGQPGLAQEVTKDKAEELIEAGKLEAHRKNVQAAIKLLLKEGYTLTLKDK